MSSFGVQPHGARDLMPFGLATAEFFFVFVKYVFVFVFEKCSIVRFYFSVYIFLGVFCWLLFHKTKYEQLKKERSVGSSSTKKKRGNLRNDAIRRHYILDHRRLHRRSFYLFFCPRHSIIRILPLSYRLSHPVYLLSSVCAFAVPFASFFSSFYYCHCLSSEHFFKLLLLFFFIRSVVSDAFIRLHRITWWWVSVCLSCYIFQFTMNYYRFFFVFILVMITSTLIPQTHTVYH